MKTETKPNQNQTEILDTVRPVFGFVHTLIFFTHLLFQNSYF